MVPYATNSSERKNVPFVLAVLSILFALALNRLQVWFDFTIPWYVESPSVLGFYGLLYSWFDKNLWNLNTMRRTGLVRIPNLNGKWEGYILSSADNYAEKKPAVLVVKQSWTEISLKLESAQSKSDNLTSSINILKTGSVEIIYEYRNEPNATAPKTMNPNRGTAHLEYQENELKGDYYTGRGRETHGEMYFTRTM